MVFNVILLNTLNNDVQYALMLVFRVHGDYRVFGDLETRY